MTALTLYDMNTYMPVQNEVIDKTGSFESDVRDVLTEVRAAMTDLIGALPGNPRRPNTVSRVLGIDRNLAWKVTRVIGETDAFRAAGHIPGSNGLNILLDAATKQGVSADAVGAVRSAAERYRKLISDHAGDRASLQLLLSGQSRKGRRQAEILHSRAAFRANSFILGIQARTYLRADFVYGVEDGKYDIASVSHLTDLLRIRPDAPYIVMQPRSSGDDGVFHDTATEPIDREHVRPGEVPLITEFSSQPLPKFQSVDMESSYVEHRLEPGPVGKAGAISFSLGDIGRSVEALIRTPENPHAGLSALVRVPCEVFIYDNYIHEDLCKSDKHEAAIYSNIYGRMMVEGPAHEAHRIPSDVEVEYLGKGASVVLTPDVPRYPELAQYVFDRLDWVGERFNVYRVRLQFPFIPSSVYMRH